MKPIIFLLGCAAFFMCGCQPANSPDTQRRDLLAIAKHKGETRAKADISKGITQILYYGKPWSTDKPLVDDESGLSVKIADGCDVTPEFVAETDAYNQIMRQTAKEKAPNKVLEATPSKRAAHQN